MKFEDIVKKVSTFLAAFVIFFFAAAVYLQTKGFVRDPNGNIVLMNTAQAKPAVEKKIAANIVLPTGHVLGQENAPITIYEYSSLTCFHCADFHTGTLPQLKKDYIDTGKVKLIFSNFPIDKKAMQAAMISECIPQKNYFQFLDLLFRKQREWSMSSKTENLLTQFAALNGISEEQAKKCLDNSETAKEIMNTRQNAIDQLGIMGTPSLLIVKGSDRQLLPGAPSYGDLQKILDKTLAQN